MERLDGRLVGCDTDDAMAVELWNPVTAAADVADVAMSQHQHQRQQLLARDGGLATLGRVYHCVLRPFLDSLAIPPFAAAPTGMQGYWERVRHEIVRMDMCLSCSVLLMKAPWKSLALTLKWRKG